MDWRQRNWYYRNQIERQLTFHVSITDSLLVLGCGSGEIFTKASSNRSVGIDTDENLIRCAKSKVQEGEHVEFHHVAAYTSLPKLEQSFDIIILYDVIAEFGDIQDVLNGLRRFMTPRSRLIVNFHSHLWMPALHVAENLGLKRPTLHLAWVTIEDMSNFAALTDFEIVTNHRCILLPKKAFGLGPLMNRLLAPLPVMDFFCLENVVVLRPLHLDSDCADPTVTVVVPARNEAGNIENAVKRLPSMGKHTEIIFVEGHSSDNTWDEIKRVQQAYPELDIKAMRQTGKGKGDAVRHGFDSAQGNVLMILDADLTVSPEDLPKFYHAIIENKGELINGCRLVYPLETQAMRFLNMVANKSFGWLFTWLLGQRYRDTLCGTKVLWKSDYNRIAAGREFFGDLDPFGDFDFIFGATKLGLKMIEVPIRYKDRTYGKTNISRFRHGFILLRMSFLAAWRLKFGRF